VAILLQNDGLSLVVGFNIYGSVILGSCFSFITSLGTSFEYTSNISIEIYSATTAIIKVLLFLNAPFAALVYPLKI